MTRIFMCYCGNTAVEWIPNKSQHRKLTLEKKVLLPLFMGLEPTTFRSWMWCSASHWTVPTPHPPILLPSQHPLLHGMHAVSLLKCWLWLLSLLALCCVLVVHKYVFMMQTNRMGKNWENVNFCCCGIAQPLVVSNSSLFCAQSTITEYRIFIVYE